jgi:cyclic-di-AMP phosphodiesterase PgpH
VKGRSALRRALDSLSGRPERVWPDAAVHHGVRGAILFLLAYAILAFFPVAPVLDFPVLERGMVADEDIIAQVPFPIFKTDAELMRERAEAAASVAPVFDYDPATTDTVLSRVRSFTSRVDSAAAPGADAEVRSRVRAVLAAYGFSASDDVVEFLRAPARRAMLGRALERAIREELPPGIGSSADLEETPAAQVRLRRDQLERLVPRDSIQTGRRFHERATRHLPPNAPPEMAELHRLVLIRFFEPNIRLNREATEAAREAMRQAVSVVKAEVLRGEKIVGAHEQIRDAEIERLHAYQEELARLGELGSEPSGGLRSVGGFLFNLLVLSIYGLLLYFFRPRVYHEFRHLLVVAFLFAAFTGAAALISRSGWPIELLPIAFPALVVAVLWDGRMALNLSLILAVLLSGQSPFLGVSVPFLVAVGGGAAGLSVRAVRSRSQTWVFIAIISAAYFAAAVALGLMRSREFMEIVWSASWAILSTTVGALIAMGTIPLFESFTRITTDQTLLELGDLNRPLLKRLSLEANGTYHHSLNVANLAEAGARAVGANPLLARVGSYYHDVGKLVKPHYFIENQHPGRNPHDKLKPAVSAAVIRNHVQEGLRLAGEYKLPGCLRDFIAEHHGTQPISFFYDRARELDPQGDLDPRDYTYPGPRPRSRESAIIMLADSLESASRVLHEHTPERIRELVERLIDRKIEQGQLDESPLTFRDLALVKDQFAAVLGGMYHHRIDYPPVRTLEEQAAVGDPVLGKA